MYTVVIESYHPECVSRSCRCLQSTWSPEIHHTQHTKFSKSTVSLTRTHCSLVNNRLNNNNNNSNNKKYILWNVYLSNAVAFRASLSKYLTVIVMTWTRTVQGHPGSKIMVPPPWWFPIWPPLCPTSYLSPFSKYLTLKMFSIEAMVIINSTSGLANRNISDFHQNNR